LPVVSAELETELVGRARMRSRLAVVGRDEVVALALAALFLGGAVLAIAFLPAVRPFDWVAALMAVGTLAAVSQVEFEVGNGSVMATELLLVPMLFVLPPRAVPLLVAAGFLARHLPGLARGTLSPSHVPILVINASYALGPAVVIALAGATTAGWDRVPVYVLALAAQLTADFAVSASWSRLVWRVPLAEHARAMRISFLVDASLAPIGLTVAIASGGTVWGIVAVLPLVGLLKVFARERQVRIDHALELSSAYRGTALLLGDVIEADDAYTGSHSREVVDLVVAVTHRLHLDPVERRRAEFAALLHDVGKVKIPSEIINKPGPLDPEERAIINTHTIIGEKMLSTVGGLLGDIGHVVRSSHERWDGGGYPDGLAGEEIPLAARIVCACDAWSAMTNDRSYRKALPAAEAADELLRCSGTQFDPTVVDALFDVLDVDFA
jgi:HD-GYP domain-containing protein (c-di-GMP phosphodiesterase class II)